MTKMSCAPFQQAPLGRDLEKQKKPFVPISVENSVPFSPPLPIELTFQRTIRDLEEERRIRRPDPNPDPKQPKIDLHNARGEKARARTRRRRRVISASYTCTAYPKPALSRPPLSNRVVEITYNMILDHLVKDHDLATSLLSTPPLQKSLSLVTTDEKFEKLLLI